MTKKKRPERRLIMVSQRRPVSDEGLARLVAAMVMQRIREDNAARQSDIAEESDAG